MTNSRSSVTLKFEMVVATCGQLLMVSAILMAQQVNPHGIPPPPRSTHDPERESDPEYSRSVKRVDSKALDRQLTLKQIKKDFQEIQVLNDELLRQVSSNSALDHKQISEAASRIRTLAGRLDSNLVLGKSDSGREPRPEYEFSEAALRSSLLTVHDLVVRFVENPTFRERGVFDIQETKKAKEDVDDIIALSDQIKQIAKRLRKDASKQLP